MSFDELKAAFLAAMDTYDGNVSAAAREVGANRNSAYAWARQAGLRARGKPGNDPHPRRDEYDQLRARGMRRREAAAVVGVHERTAKDWDRGVRKGNGARLYPDGRRVDYRIGTTTMVDMDTFAPTLAALSRPLHPRYLTLQEREKIADMRREGASLRAVGRCLARSASTIKREIDTYTDEAGGYRPHAAHRAWTQSRARAKEAKLARPGPLRDYVIAKLGVKWSPEQIHSVLIKDFPGDEDMRVSTETIYQAIYVQARGGNATTLRDPTSRPVPTCASVTRIRRGSAAVTRTRTGCCVSTSPRALT